MSLMLLDKKNPHQDFPSVNLALLEPEGLLAVGGCLSEQRLLTAYRHGVFPWYNQGEPILWWSPNPRLVLYPKSIIISKSLNKTFRKHIFKITYDQAFTHVITECAKKRKVCNETWISPEIITAYTQLHRQGHAHSIEAWQDSTLVGGLYGISIGQVFFGESMFHTQTDSSKIAFISLVNWLYTWGYKLIDCQVHSEHLVSLGAENISRTKFIDLLNFFCEIPAFSPAWK